MPETDEQSPVMPTAEQQRELDRLGGEVDRIWHRPLASLSLKKQIVQLLIEEIVVEHDRERGASCAERGFTGGTSGDRSPRGD